VVSQVVLDGAEPRNAGTSWLFFFQYAGGEANISVIIHACNVPKQSKSARLDYCSEFSLLR